MRYVSLTSRSRKLKLCCEINSVKLEISFFDILCSSRLTIGIRRIRADCHAARSGTCHHALRVRVYCRPRRTNKPQRYQMSRRRRRPLAFPPSHSLTPADRSRNNPDLRSHSHHPRTQNSHTDSQRWIPPGKLTADCTIWRNRTRVRLIAQLIAHVFLT